MTPHFRYLDIAHDWAWITEKIGVLQVEDTIGIMALDLDTGENVGACIMDNWTNNSVQCHFAVTKPMILKYGFMECCFTFMFNDVGVQKVYGQVPGNNEKALRFNNISGLLKSLDLKKHMLRVSIMSLWN